MKKTALFIILALCPMMLKAWRPDFSLNRGYYSLGMLGGVVGFGTGQQAIGFGANITAWGVSLDFLGRGPAHAHTPENRTWNDKQAFTLNIGYHIPINKFLSVYPLVGYSERSTGVTDGTNYDYDYDYEDNSVTRWNEYTANWTVHQFNYGAGIAIKPAKWISLHLVATRFAMYGGIGLNLGNLWN